MCIRSCMLGMRACLLSSSAFLWTELGEHTTAEKGLRLDIFVGLRIWHHERKTWGKLFERISLPGISIPNNMMEYKLEIEGDSNNSRRK